MEHQASDDGSVEWKEGRLAFDCCCCCYCGCGYCCDGAPYCLRSGHPVESCCAGSLLCHDDDRSVESGYQTAEWVQTLAEELEYRRSGTERAGMGLVLEVLEEHRTAVEGKHRSLEQRAHGELHCRSPSGSGDP